MEAKISKDVYFTTLKTLPELFVSHPHKKLLSSERLGEGDDDLVQEELKRWREFAELLSLSVFLLP